jgi:lysyl-tRNA synthetase class 2
MLEWYRRNADYRDILRDATALLPAVAGRLLDGCVLPRPAGAIDLAADWEVIPVAEAYRRHAGWDPVARFDADRFDIDLVECVLPNLPADRPVVLIDYPAAVAALARRKPDDARVAERWELYAGGLELANAFSELTDAEEQHRRFRDCAAAREKLGRAVYPIDTDFLAALESGLPPCGGAALGIDRLLLLLAGGETLDDVLFF